jgi:hypothetical protein
MQVKKGKGSVYIIEPSKELNIWYDSFTCEWVVEVDQINKFQYTHKSVNFIYATNYHTHELLNKSDSITFKNSNVPTEFYVIDNKVTIIL